MLPQSNNNVNLQPLDPGDSGVVNPFNNLGPVIPDVAIPEVPSIVTSVVSPISSSAHRPPFEVAPGDDESVVISVTMTPSPTSSSPTVLAPIPTSIMAEGSPMDAAENPTECRLLGSFAILVQLALGGLALMSLVYKRWRERPQRPIKIWFFDASKQVFGSVLVHGANVFMSLLTSGRFNITTIDPASSTGVVVKRGLMMLMGRDEEGVGEPYVPNPCSFYLLNLAIDTTVGIPILIVIVRVTTVLVSYTPLGKPAESIQSGNYGNPPNAWWWFKQSIIYFVGLMGMKICVLILFMALPWISEIGDWALGWTEGNEKLQIVFVMMLFPLIMNGMQYYIIDSYIKKQISGSGSVGSDSDSETAAETTAYNEILGSETDDDSDDDDDSLTAPTKPTGVDSKGRRRNSLGEPTRDEYDPDVDGDSQTVIGSGSSHTSSKGVLPKELLPKE